MSERAYEEFSDDSTVESTDIDIRSMTEEVVNKKSKLNKKIRYDALRLALVDAIMISSECSGIDFCTSPDCCLYLARIAPQFGLRINKNFRSDDYSDRCLKYENPDLASKNSAEALECLSFQHEVKRYCEEFRAYDLLIEVVQVPLAVWHEYEFLINEDSDAPKSRQDALKRQIAYVLVSLAFPDSYLDHFADRINTDNKQEGSETNWEKWCKSFQEKNIPTLKLPSSITNDFSNDGPWTGLFGKDADWHEAAGYDIAFGRKEDDVMSGNLSLKELVERYPSVPSFFTWYGRGNEAGNFGGFLVRSEGLLVSQTWTTGAFSNSGDSDRFYLNTFNEYIAPFLDTDPQSEFDRVIIVFSDYSGYAYILSADPRSWNPNAPSDRIPGPFPGGYGLVDNWDHSSADYQPRSLTTFETDLFTPRLRSAARFLAECISHNQQRPPQTF